MNFRRNIQQMHPAQNPDQTAVAASPDARPLPRGEKIQRQAGPLAVSDSGSDQDPARHLRRVPSGITAAIALFRGAAELSTFLVDDVLRPREIRAKRAEPAASPTVKLAAG
ncbi:hypothetical protein ACFJIW_13810 [Tahibacter sp. UC22_41]|uniref:hypothetical protein n=1 Tax=Tahibacter sp. UC22_41 TaxID=3350178 RepID=UPI0036DA5F71